MFPLVVSVICINHGMIARLVRRLPASSGEVSRLQRALPTPGFGHQGGLRARQPGLSSFLRPQEKL